VKKGAIVAAIIAAVVVIGIAVALLQLRPIPPPEPDTTIANTTEPEAPVNIASARSAFPFVQRWVSQYNNNDDENGVSSNIEIGYYLDEPNIPNDIAIVGDIRHAANGSRAIPVSAQAVAIVYNIPSFPDVPSGMRLNSSLIDLIFNGTIAQWDDPAIKDLNQNLNLPAERIVVVHENGNSSSLTLIKNYLSTEIKWPARSVSVLGPDELATTVRKTPYSIGYVDFSYATQTRMTFASLGSPNGEYVIPSPDSIGLAVNSSILVQNFTTAAQTANLTPPQMNGSMLGNGSYPLTGLYYASLRNKPSNESMAFVRWMVDGGQQTLSEVGYPSIYQDNERLATYAATIINSSHPKGSQD